MLLAMLVLQVPIKESSCPESAQGADGSVASFIGLGIRKMHLNSLVTDCLHMCADFVTCAHELFTSPMSQCAACPASHPSHSKEPQDANLLLSLKQLYKGLTKPW